MNSRHAVAAVVVAGWCVAVAAGAQDLRHEAWARTQEMVGAFAVGFPGLGDFDVYDYSAGPRFEYRRWVNDAFGWAASLGWENWKTAGQSRNWRGRVSGDTAVVPVGVQGLMRAWQSGPAGVTLHAGLVYAWTDEDLRLDRDGGRVSVDVDSSWLGEIGVDADIVLSEQWLAFAGLTYQFDLTEAESKARGFDLEDHRMESARLLFGLKYSF
jgi:hypothetical protein